MYRTGGGPSDAPDFTDVEEKVISICSNIKGLEARHDSDTILNEPISSSDMVIMEVDIKKLGPQDTEVPKGAEETTQDISINIPDMDELFIFEQINKNNNESQKENKWDKWHPKALKTRVSNVLKPDSVNKSSVTAKLDKLSSARLELVRIQTETARKEQQFKEEEHRLKMEQDANDERRKEEIHQLLIKKLNCAPITSFNEIIN